MGRPKGSKNRKRAPYKKRPKKICTNCNRELPMVNYYVASNPLTSSDGRYVNVCKECIKAASLDMDGKLKPDDFRRMLQLIDRPYLPDVIDSAIEESKKRISKGILANDIIGIYMKMISSLPQYSKMTFMDGLEYVEMSEKEKEEYLQKKTEKEVIYQNDNSAFDLTEEIIDRFGDGYTKSQYRKMQKKYDKLKQNYQLTTNLHEEALATYVRFKVKEEEATASGDVISADKWNRAAQDAAEKAKLTPKQLTQADLQGGITAISEISKAVEESADIIEILPRFKFAPNDAPDFIIWCYVNFLRKLKGLPQIEYREVYAFYDKKKKEYIAQYGDPYGIFEDDTTAKNRDSVKKFIKLPKDYELGSDN